jgi:uncharacterized protein YdbL (DUF1318 family)
LWPPGECQKHRSGNISKNCDLTPVSSVDAVEALAGKKAIERTPPGQYVRLPSGQWVKK